MERSQLKANWHYPTDIRYGVGRIKELGMICQELVMKAPLIVTDPGLRQLPMIDNAMANCRAAGLACSVFSEITSNPTADNVMAGVLAFKQGGHDGVVAFGGGSALDAGKAIALMVGQDRPLWDFEDVADNFKRVKVQSMAAVIAIPTTSGTGSEVGRASVITDEKQQIKRLIFHPNMLAKVVILDAELTLGLPPELTAATGMDALSHALEAYCAPCYHPMAEGIALEAIRLVKNYLPRVFENGADLEARCQLLVSSTMAATAFQRGLGAMHALAHPLGAIYNSHHGLLNAVLMPYVLTANQPAINTSINRLAQYLDLPNQSFAAFLEWVISLRSELGIPHTLAAIGIDGERAVQIGEMAVQDPCANTNPISFTAQQYSDIFLSAVNGEL